LKKILQGMLVLLVVLLFAGCGANNDENDAEVQTKMDEVLAAGHEFVAIYEDNGFLEGEDAVTIQPIVDRVIDQMDEVEAQHNANLEAGGYSDEAKATMLEVLSGMIDAYNTGITSLNDLLAAKDAIATSPEFLECVEKFDTFSEIVNEAETQSITTGWDVNESFITELDAAKQYIDILATDLSNPSTLDAEYVAYVNTSLDEMISSWESILEQVSMP